MSNNSAKSLLYEEFGLVNMVTCSRLSEQTFIEHLLFLPGTMYAKH